MSDPDCCPLCGTFWKYHSEQLCAEAVNSESERISLAYDRLKKDNDKLKTEVARLLAALEQAEAERDQWYELAREPHAARAELHEQRIVNAAETDRADAAEGRLEAAYDRNRGHIARAEQAEAEVARLREALQTAMWAMANAHHLLLKYGDTQAHPWLASFKRDMDIVKAALAAKEGA